MPGRGAVSSGLMALCNHSRRPNARVRYDLARETLDLIATAPIATGNEVTIGYNCPLWFEAARDCRVASFSDSRRAP